MAKNGTKRIKPSMLQTDKDCCAAIETLGGYSPVNSRYALDALRTMRDELSITQQAEAEAIAAAGVARQSAMAKEWEFHNLMLGAKDQVVAQFGRDSNEAEAVGFKKKSEYKTRTRKESARDALS
jgi:DNA-binding XRE family transcriptional regulator